MRIIKGDVKDAGRLASLVADFRVTLRSFKGIESKPDLEAGREEIQSYLEEGWPVFAAEEDGKLVGYLVCRIDEPCLWVEHIFVSSEFRRRGVASMLFEKAEEIAAELAKSDIANTRDLEARLPSETEKGQGELFTENNKRLAAQAEAARAIRELDLAQLTPIEAFFKLHELQQKLGGDGK